MGLSIFIIPNFSFPAYFLFYLPCSNIQMTTNFITPETLLFLELE